MPRRIQSALLLMRFCQVVLLHAAEGLAQFIGGLGLTGAQRSRRLLHLLFELAERFGSLLAIVAELGLFPALAQAIGRIAMGEHLPLARFLVLLFLLQAVAFAGHGVHLLRGFALLQAAHEVGSFLQTFGRAASRGVVLILARPRVPYLPWPGAGR